MPSIKISTAKVSLTAEPNVIPTAQAILDSEVDLCKQRKSIFNPNNMKSPMEKIDINKKFELQCENLRPDII